MNTLFNKRLISLLLAGIMATTSLAFSASSTSDLQNGGNATNTAKLDEITENLIRALDQIKGISKGRSQTQQTQTPSDIEESVVSSQENANTTQQAPAAESDSKIKSEEITDASNLQNPETAKPLAEELSEELFIGDLFEAIATGHIEDLIK